MPIRRPLEDIRNTANYPEAKAATIAAGASLSGAVDLDGCHPVGLVMPAAWTAASITFQVSLDGVTYNNLYDSSGSEYTITTAASRRIILPPSDFAGVNYLKLRSGTSGAPVNQVAQAVIQVVARAV